MCANEQIENDGWPGKQPAYLMPLNTYRRQQRQKNQRSERQHNNTYICGLL